MQEPRIRIESALSVPLANRLENCRKIFGIKTINRTVQQLIEIGLNAIENADRVNTPQKVQQLMKEFEEGAIVDYIKELDRDSFNILFSIMNNEYKERFKKK